MSRSRARCAVRPARVWTAQNGGSTRRSGCIPGAAGTNPLKKAVSDGATVRIGFAPGASSTTWPLALSTERNKSDSGSVHAKNTVNGARARRLASAWPIRFSTRRSASAGFHSRYQAHVAFLRGCFESARPIPAVVRLYVGMNRGFERAFEPGEVVRKRTAQRPPRHTSFIVERSEWLACFAR